jgi:hypothetical protein
LCRGAGLSETGRGHGESGHGKSGETQALVNNTAHHEIL